MKNVLVRLEEYLPRASEAERGAIKWLMQSPESAVDLSIQQLAGRTFTSASTIIRLCRKLGFDGYKEFHKALLYELAVRREASDEQTREIDRADTLEAIAQKVNTVSIPSNCQGCNELFLQSQLYQILLCGGNELQNL